MCSVSSPELYIPISLISLRWQVLQYNCFEHELLCGRDARGHVVHVRVEQCGRALERETRNDGVHDQLLQTSQHTTLRLATVGQQQ